MKASNLDNPVNSMMRKPMTKKDLMQSDKLRSDDCDKDLSPKKQKVNSGQRKTPSRTCHPYRTYILR